MLLVLALLMVLATMVAKGLFRAREESLSVRCASHLYQLGFGIFAYAEHNADFLPHEDFGVMDPPHDQCWYTEVDPYLSWSPPERAKQDPMYLDEHNENPQASGFSYKMNSRLENYKGTKKEASPAFRNLNTIPWPRKTVLFFDGDLEGMQRHRSYGMYRQVVNRHRGRANLLMGDFSVLDSEGLGEPTNWVSDGELIWDPEEDP